MKGLVLLMAVVMLFCFTTQADAQCQAGKFLLQPAKAVAAKVKAVVQRVAEDQPVRSLLQRQPVRTRVKAIVERQPIRRALRKAFQPVNRVASRLRRR